MSDPGQVSLDIQVRGLPQPVFLAIREKALKDGVSDTYGSVAKWGLVELGKRLAAEAQQEKD